MGIPAQRDPDVTRKVLADWFERQVPEARDVEISELKVPEESGFSNETLMADVRWHEQDGARRDSIVVRVKPTGYKVFLEADFEQQWRLLSLLDKETDVPVPPMLWFEQDESVLGAPFFVMRKVNGRAAPDNPNYNTAGWLYDAPPAQREKAWRGAVEALVRVHRVPTEQVAFLSKPELGETGFDQIFNYWGRSFEWAARGKPQPIAEAAWEWLNANMPASRPTALSWGDCRVANVLFDPQGDVAAVVDWEMLSLGGHEMDLGWWLFLDDFHSYEVPRLEGLGSKADTVALWEEGTGEKATDLHWYEVFAGFRFAVIMMRLAQMFNFWGGGDPEAQIEMETNNAVTHVLALDLGIAPPGPLPPMPG
jgi:aminoglycoside phosphotransferase (APT) family kinase protein